jgi:hypothetical protein
MKSIETLIPTGCDRLDDIFKETSTLLEHMLRLDFSTLKRVLIASDLANPPEDEHQALITSYRDAVRNHLGFAAAQLDEILGYFLENIGQKDAREEESIALYVPDNGGIPVAKLVVTPNQRLDSLVVNGDSFIYRKEGEVFDWEDGTLRRKVPGGWQDLKVVRVGKVYYLNGGEVILSRNKKRWDEKNVRIFFADVLQTAKGFRDTSAMMILDRGYDRSVETELVELLDLGKPRKPYRDQPVDGKPPVNHYFSSDFPVPLEVLTLSHDTFERMETGDLSHEKNYKERIERELSTAAIIHEELARAWIVLSKVCALDHIAPNDVYNPSRNQKNL